MPMAQQSDRERWWTVKVSVRLLQTPEGRSLRYRSGGGEKLAERHSSFRSMARNTSSRPKCPFPAPVAQFGWSWIGIGSSDCEPAGGCRLAQSESRIHGAQQRQSVSRSKFEQRCAAVRSSIHSRADRGEGATARWVGSGQAPSRSWGDQWQASSENRKDIIPEHETNLRARGGVSPPHLLQKRSC